MRGDQGVNSRERVLATINREPVDRFPVDIWYTDEVMESLQRYFNETDKLSLFKKMGLDKMVWIMHIPYKGKGKNREARVIPESLLRSESA